LTGNVPAGYEKLRIFKETLKCPPDNIGKANLRSDTAGYQHELLHYCEMAGNKRFGRIEFAMQISHERYKLFEITTNTPEAKMNG